MSRLSVSFFSSFISFNVQRSNIINITTIKLTPAVSFVDMCRATLR